MEKNSFENQAYQAYKLDWMKAHGYTLDEYAKKISEGEDVEETGFSGEIWACKEEFMDSEFQDREYMYNLLSSMPHSSELLRFWKDEYLMESMDSFDIYEMFSAKAKFDLAADELLNAGLKIGGMDDEMFNFVNSISDGEYGNDEIPAAIAKWEDIMSRAAE